jgi:hypothetical protein
MRDIRSDLQERATLIDGEIRAAYAHFEKTVQQLQSERDARISDLKSGLAMIGKFMEFEERYLGNSSPVVPGSQYGSQRRFFPRRRKRGARRAPYARKPVAKRANSRVAKRNLRASHHVAGNQASKGGLMPRTADCRPSPSPAILRTGARPVHPISRHSISFIQSVSERRGPEHCRA